MFNWKGKAWLHEKKEALPLVLTRWAIGCMQWLLIPSSDSQSIIMSPLVRMSAFLQDLPTMISKAMLIWAQSAKVWSSQKTQGTRHARQFLWNSWIYIIFHNYDSNIFHKIVPVHFNSILPSPHHLPHCTASVGVSCSLINISSEIG